MFAILAALALSTIGTAPLWAVVSVTGSPAATPREKFGIERLREAVAPLRSNARVVAGTRDSGIFDRFGDVPRFAPSSSEAFTLRRSGETWIVAGSDASGVLYGCLELARRIRENGALPSTLDVSDAPRFVLRGPSIGMQKTEITYDGAIYDYRYTPQEFPFFYDRAHWTRYLDFLLENRMNTLYLWNGHPFTSLLKLERYPDAQELTGEQLNRNIEMFRWLTSEADRRGIWVIQLFYNIHISHALAKSRGVGFHHTTPSPLTSEYTRYCISEFIRTYPNVGLMMTLGEALAPRHGPEWLTKTIIPGVRDGMRALGVTTEPPIIVRAHATEVEEAMRQALPLYKNIYTMHKWNGESLTWTDVRGDVLRLHKSLVGLGSTHISNLHLMSNLEPFRWGSPEFVRETMLSHDRIGIRGLHLYPLRYWDWPVTADKASPALLQIDRDWIWYEAWARYAWNPHRDAASERAYWIGRLASKYGSRAAAEKILDAYQSVGVCAPRLLPRIGITEGNRQAFSLGMLMTQLINPERYNAFTLLWTGDAPPGERLREYAEREWLGKPHEGETPVGVADEVAASAERALTVLEAARKSVTTNREEFERLLNDVRCIRALMLYYQAKTHAAALVLRYGYSRDVEDLRKALPLLTRSVGEYRKLVQLTENTYREACSVHSGSRRIPFLGAPGRFTHWRDCLPHFEKELETFGANLQRGVLSKGGPERSRSAWPSLRAKLTAGAGELFRLERGPSIYTDRQAVIEDLAPELEGLTGIRIAAGAARETGARIEIELPEPAHVLIGFFKSPSRNAAAAPPKDEWQPVLWNGVAVKDHPGLSVWSHALPAGRSEIALGLGAYVVLGFVKANVQLEPRMVFFANSDAQARTDLDWLFE